MTTAASTDSADRIPIILDCDPGHDDAVAIMLALGSPRIDVLGITTVGGNQTLAKVTRNAQSVLEVCKRPDVPVYTGAPRPLVHEVEVAESIHGDTGMDGPHLPEPSVAVQDQNAVLFIIDTVMNAEPGTVTLVATGPCTNIALAARAEPRIVERVREVVIMGGGYHGGNWTAAAEFNIWVDPEAARMVFEDDWPVTMVGLDLTHQALATAEVEAKAKEIGSDVAEFFLGLMDFFREAYKENQGFDDPPVHDPCTIAYLLDPSIVSTQKVPVRVETRGEFTVGMTVADFRAPAPEDCHTQVAVKLDHEKFWDLVMDAIRNLG